LNTKEAWPVYNRRAITRKIAKTNFLSFCFIL